MINHEMIDAVSLSRYRRSMVRKAVIPAAGLGTRLLPVTKAVAKELLPVAARPSIEYVVEEAVEAGISELIFVLSPRKRNVVGYFRPDTEVDALLADHSQYHILEYLYNQFSKIQFSVVIQEEAKGLGHAVACAKKAVGNEDFMVLLPDDLIETAPNPSLSKQMIDLHTQSGGKSVVALVEVPQNRVSSYGIVAGKEIQPDVYQLTELVEKPSVEKAPSRLAIVGRYILSPRVFDSLAQEKPGSLGEIQLTDALISLAHAGDLLGYRFHGRRFDVGVPNGLAMANLYYLRHDPDVQALIQELAHDPSL